MCVILCILEYLFSPPATGGMVTIALAPQKATVSVANAILAFLILATNSIIVENAKEPATPLDYGNERNADGMAEDMESTTTEIPQYVVGFIADLPSFLKAINKMADEYDYGVAHGSLKLKTSKQLFKKKSKKPRKPAKPTAKKTDAEAKFEETRRKRKLEHPDNKKTFSDRVKEFNEKLELTPEHNDMPKVGP
ncbi:hypothetical protein BX070DRAFT_252815 [Coemansia spiralis]|nr:hypothetical protein BX070DRAFT_252815 [Coemansia spiralis]